MIINAKMFFYKLGLVCIALVFMGQMALANLDNRLTQNTKGGKANRFSGLIMGLHYTGFGDQRNEPSSLMIGQINYQRAGWVFFVSQFMQKLYYLNDSSEDEFLFFDTWLGAQKSGNSPLNGRYQFRTRFTLPVSEFSIRNDVITKPDLRLRNSWSFLDKKLTLTLGAEVIFYVNRFTTTQTGPQDGGLGMPLPLVRYAAQSLLSYSITPRLMATTYAFYVRREFETLGPDNFVSDGNVPLHDFWYGVSLDYQLRSRLGVYAAMDHSNTLEQNGGVEFYMFDPVTTQWSVGVNYTF